MVTDRIEPRAVRLASTPFLSLVVASRSEQALVEQTLWDLALECSGAGLELIVARAGATTALEAAFPDVRFVRAAEGSAVEELRALGVMEAQGDIIAFTDDDTSVPEEWLAWLTMRRSERIRIEQEQTSLPRSAPETERTGQDA